MNLRDLAEYLEYCSTLRGTRFVVIGSHKEEWRRWYVCDTGNPQTLPLAQFSDKVAAIFYANQLNDALDPQEEDGE